MRFDFPRAEILASIKANHDRHRDEVAEALAAWRADVAEVLDLARAEIDVTIQRARDGSLGARDDLHGLRRHRLPDPPVSHDDDYVLAIRMLELAGSEQIALDEREFARYVLDRWDWRDEFDERMYGYRVKYGESIRRRRG